MDRHPPRPCSLASLKFTLANLLLLLAGAVAVARYWLPPTWALALPFALLAVNLAAAIACNETFRRNPPLLGFHLALLALLLLAALGRMTYLSGWVELAENAEFSGELGGYEAGPWHPWRLDRVRFVSERIELDYRGDATRFYPQLEQTRSWVSWDDGGRRVVQQIGDNKPLVRSGYHFYTTTQNKGLAPTFTWIPDDPERPAGTGIVHLPSYPDFRFGQAVEWQPPGLDEKLWVLLDFDQELLPADRDSRFEPPEEYRLIVRRGDQRHLLQPGDRLRLAGGVLRFHGLNRWLGYTVHWDMTLFWMLGAAALAVACLVWFLAVKFRRQGWQVDE